MKEGRKIVGGKRSKGSRQRNDYYKTCPFGIKALIDKEEINGKVLEPACGDGIMSKKLKDIDKITEVISMDIVDRGYGKVQDYFKYKPKKKFDYIITNPPYKEALKFINKALKEIKEDGKVCMLLKLVFLESQTRYSFFQKHPPSKIYVFSKRLGMWKGGKKIENKGYVCYAWFIWEKDNEELPKVDWILED